MANKLQRNAPEWHGEAVQMIRDNFEKIHTQFLDATKKAVWLGLFLNFIKQRGREDKSIPHGEFGPWLTRNVPHISRDTCTTYMTLARNVAEKGKFQITDFPQFAHAGELPRALEKIVEGKTQQQLFLEFKQAKVNADGELEPVRGRVAGCEPGFTGHKTVEERRRWVMQRVGHGLKEFDKCQEEILLLDDDALAVLLSDLERRTKLIHFWLKTPLGRRDAAAAQEFWRKL